jgi:hypothetical protein
MNRKCRKQVRHWFVRVEEHIRREIWARKFLVVSLLEGFVQI